MAQDDQIPQDEERLLMTVSEECRVQERALADQLSHPRHGMLYPAYKRLLDAYQATRIECKAKYLAVRTYQKKMRDDRRADKRNNAAVLQAHSLSMAATPEVHAPPKDAARSWMP